MEISTSSYFSIIVRRFDRSPMFSREEAVGIAENAVDKLGDSVSYL